MSKDTGGIECAPLPSEGDVAYFVHLHLDTAAVKGAHPRQTATWVYHVEGKPRPMLVLTCLKQCDRGRRWFLVLPITTKGYDGKGRRRSDVEPIGRCIDPDRDSFVRVEPCRLPENLLFCGNGGSAIVRSCDPLGVGNALKILEHKLRKGSYCRSSGLTSNAPVPMRAPR